MIDVLALAIEADGLSNAGNHLKATAGAGNLALDALRPRGFAVDKVPAGESRLMKTIGHGYYWNDLEVGFKFRTLNRTITESDLVGFINTTGMLEMIFIDQTFAHEGGIKGRVVPAALPYALMEGLLCQTVQQMTGLALLEIEKKVLKPTLVGDTIHSEVEVVAIKPTSRGNRAVVTTMNNIVNQQGDTVISYKAVRMMAGRAPGSKSDR